MSINDPVEMLRGNAPTRTPNVRVLAAASAHGDCNFSRLALAASVNIDLLCRGTYFAADFGQDPQAFQRGKTFERRVKEPDYAPLIQLLREQAGFPLQDVRIRNLYSGLPLNTKGFEQRAVKTRQLLRQMILKPVDAPNIIDGAVLTCQIAGRTAYFEADSLAAVTGGRVHVVEIKSFPFTDGQCDPKNLGAAGDQASWYALLVRQTLEQLKLPPSAVSEWAYIILPQGVGLQPSLQKVHIGHKIRRATELLATAPQPQAVLQFAGKLKFPDLDESPDKRIGLLEHMMDEVGTTYHPECLQDCGMARLCRARAQQVGTPSICGSSIVRVLPGVRTLERASELSRGAQPAPAEAFAAQALRTSGAIYARVLKTRAL